MSTIVAVIKNGTACMAADSLTTFGDTRQAADYVVDANKILCFDDSFIGVVGSAAHHLVLRSVFANHRDKIDFSSQLAVFETLRTLHPILKDDYFLNSKDHDEDAYETSRIDALVMSPAGLFGIYALREVDQYTRFWAVGSGAEFALGAMHAVFDDADSAEAVATAGINAGATFDTSSALPMNSFSIKLQKN